MAKCIRERNTPIAKSEKFREALINAENALRALKTDKSVIVDTEKEAFEIAEKAIKAGIVVTSVETLLQDGYTTIGDVAVDVSLPAKYVVKCE